MGERVRITEVAPRDGLQNEPGAIPTDDKIRLVELATMTGVDEVEVTSFVSAKWVPQLGDAEKVLEGLDHAKRYECLWSVLTPNERGVERALRVNEDAGYQLVDKVAVFTAASQAFSQANTNATIEESLERFKPVVRRAGEAGLKLRGYLSCVIACPFEGAVAPAEVAKWAAELHALGIEEIDLGDTIGAGTPETIEAMLGAVQSKLGDSASLTLHLHDTNGRAAECVRKALEVGIRSFDGSVAGLGGCPYASTDHKRAPGNISTEVLVETVEGEGYETGVDRELLREAVAFARTLISEVAGA